jgi:hypothetical protein
MKKNFVNLYGKRDLMVTSIRFCKVLSLVLFGYTLMLPAGCTSPEKSVQPAPCPPCSVSPQTPDESCGVRHIADEQSNLRSHSGPLSLSGCTMKSHLSVQGPCTAQDTDFKKGLTVTGPTTLKGTKNKVGGPVTVQGGLWTDGMIYAGAIDIVGYLEAQDCTFKKPITIKTTKITLKNCTVPSTITINDRDDHPATVILDHCTVTGTICTKSGRGIIRSTDSKITSKNVTGALIQ